MKASTDGMQRRLGPGSAISHLTQARQVSRMNTVYQAI